VYDHFILKNSVNIITDIYNPVFVHKPLYKKVHVTVCACLQITQHPNKHRHNHGRY